MDGFLEALLTAVLEPLLSLLASVAQGLFEMILGLLWGVAEAFLETVLEVLFREFLGPPFHFLTHGIVNVLLYGIAVPVSCAVCTPFVLSRAMSGPGGYAGKVSGGYRAICEGVAHLGGWLP